MGRMVRKQIYIEPEQERLLKRRSKELGVSEAELVRRAIGESVRFEVRSQDRAAAWQEALKLIRRRMAMKVPQTGRSWTRDELYEERIERLANRQ